MPDDFSALLARFDATLEAKFPLMHRSLRPGVQEAALHEFESKHDVVLPSEFRQLYLWHDGQFGTSEENSGPRCSLFGSLNFQAFSTVRFYMESWLNDPNQLEDWEDGRGEHPSHPEGHIQSIYLRPWWLAFADGPSAESLCVDLEPDARGTRGQVIVWGADFDDRYVLAESLGAFFEMLLEQLERGEVRLAGSSSYAELRWGGARNRSGHVRDTFAGWGAVPSHP